MRPLVKRTPDGRRYTVPSTPQRPAPKPARQPASGTEGGPEPAPTRQSERRPKLNDEDVREARALHAAGEFGVTDLAYIFGISQPTMSAVIGRRTWQHVADEPTPRGGE